MWPLDVGMVYPLFQTSLIILVCNFNFTLHIKQAKQTSRFFFVFYYYLGKPRTQKVLVSLYTSIYNNIIIISICPSEHKMRRIYT